MRRPRPPWLRRLGACLAATAIALCLFGRQYAEALAHGRPRPALGLLVVELTSVYAVMALLPVVARVARRFPLSYDARSRWFIHLGPHTLMFVAFSIAHTTLDWGSRRLLFSALGLGDDDYGALPIRYAAEAPGHLIVYGLLVLGVEKVDRLRAAFQQEIRTAELEALWARTRLENLRLQLHPHFLFNALNTISSVMYENARRADAMIAKLAELLRRALRDGASDEVPLREEMTLLRHYLDIMRARFEERLTVDVEVDTDALDALVPPMLLQPLAENAIRHGNVTLVGRGMIAITVRRQPDGLRIEVVDDGPGPRELDASLLGKGVGLSATSERLRHLYGDEHMFGLSQDAGGGLRVTIGLPYRLATAESGHVIRSGGRLLATETPHA